MAGVGLTVDTQAFKTAISVKLGIANYMRKL
jgi:hypothetical protein